MTGAINIVSPPLCLNGVRTVFALYFYQALILEQKGVVPFDATFFYPGRGSESVTLLCLDNAMLGRCTALFLALAVSGNVRVGGETFS